MVHSRTWFIIFAVTSVLLFMPSFLPHSSALEPKSAGSGSTVSANIETQVSIDPQGHVHVLWAVSALNGSKTDPGIWYSEYDPNGATSFPPTLIWNSTFVQSADMIVDKSGNAYIVWAEEQPAFKDSNGNSDDKPSSKLYYGEANAISARRFEPSVLAGANGVLMWPSLVTDNNESTYVVWTTVDGSGPSRIGLYYGLVRNSSTISRISPIVVYNQSNISPPRPNVAFDVVSHYLHVAWTERFGSPNNVVSSNVDYAKVDLKTGNSIRVRVASSSGLFEDATAVAAKGKAYVVWESGVGVGGSNFFYAAQISNSGTVSFVKRLARPMQTSPAYLAVSTDSQDNLYAIWYQPTAPNTGQASQTTATSASISYLKMENDGSLVGSWSDTISEPVIAVTVSDTGDLYAVSQKGIIRVAGSSNGFGFLMVGAISGVSAVLAGASTVEEFRYRILRSLARMTQTTGGETDGGITEESKLLRALSQDPGSTLNELRSSLPQNKPSMFRLARLEKQGYVSSVRAGLRRRFYYSGRDRAGAPLTAFETVASRIVCGIESNPGIWEAKLAQNLHLSQQIVHYHLRRLQAGGFLRAETSGKRKCYWLTGSNTRRKESETDGNFYKADNETS